VGRLVIAGCSASSSIGLRVSGGGRKIGKPVHGSKSLVAELVEMCNQVNVEGGRYTLALEGGLEELGGDDHRNPRLIPGGDLYLYWTEKNFGCKKDFKGQMT